MPEINPEIVSGGGNMNEDMLWEKFAESGSIVDYLLYSASKCETDLNDDNCRGNCS